MTKGCSLPAEPTSFETKNIFQTQLSFNYKFPTNGISQSKYNFNDCGKDTSGEKVRGIEIDIKRSNGPTILPKSKNFKKDNLSRRRVLLKAQDLAHIDNESLDECSNNYIRNLTESEKYLDKVARYSCKSTSDDVSTSNESGDDHHQSAKCAPPRISRISQFENKSMKTYNQEHQQKFKTEICRNWELTNNCKFGKKCAYAHGTQELKEKIFLNSNYKTKVCKQFAKEMYCSYGTRCQFLHEHTQAASDKANREQRNVSNKENCTSYVEELKQYGRRTEVIVKAEDIEVLLNHSQEHKRGYTRLKVFESLANRDE